MGALPVWKESTPDSASSFSSCALPILNVSGSGELVSCVVDNGQGKNAPADQTVRDSLVADAYSRFLDAALDEPAVKMVVTWGLSDRHSWIVRHETHESKWRDDGAPSRPLPFDSDLKAKPACEAIARAFANAPRRASG